MYIREIDRIPFTASSRIWEVRPECQRSREVEGGGYLTRGMPAPRLTVM